MAPPPRRWKSQHQQLSFMKVSGDGIRGRLSVSRPSRTPRRFYGQSECVTLSHSLVIPSLTACTGTHNSPHLPLPLPSSNGQNSSSSPAQAPVSNFDGYVDMVEMSEPIPQDLRVRTFCNRRRLWMDKYTTLYMQ